MLKIRTTENIYCFTVIIYYILTYFSEKQLSQNKDREEYLCLIRCKHFKCGAYKMQLDSIFIQLVNNYFIEIHENLASYLHVIRKGRDDLIAFSI